MLSSAGLESLSSRRRYNRRNCGRPEVRYIGVRGLFDVTEPRSPHYVFTRVGVYTYFKVLKIQAVLLFLYISLSMIA